MWISLCSLIHCCVLSPFTDMLFFLWCFSCRRVMEMRDPYVDGIANICFNGGCFCHLWIYRACLKSLLLFSFHVVALCWRIVGVVLWCLVSLVRISKAMKTPKFGAMLIPLQTKWKDSTATYTAQIFAQAAVKLLPATTKVLCFRVAEFLQLLLFLPCCFSLCVKHFIVCAFCNHGQGALVSIKMILWKIAMPTRPIGIPSASFLRCRRCLPSNSIHAKLLVLQQQNHLLSY